MPSTAYSTGMFDCASAFTTVAIDAKSSFTFWPVKALVSCGRHHGGSDRIEIVELAFDRLNQRARETYPKDQLIERCKRLGLFQDDRT